jgi:hypothetical protein
MRSLLKVDDYAAWDRGFFKPKVVAPEYLGLSVSTARSLAARSAAERVRVVELDGQRAPNITFDNRPNRLTLLVREGVVVRAGWF